MFTLLRKIRKEFIRLGQARKYILYALGEIVLVVLGILIALQINNHNNRSIEKSKELYVLNELRKIISVDLPTLQFKLDQVEDVAQKITRFQNQVESGTQVDSLVQVCGVSYGVLYFELNTSAYEDLRSRGFDLISDDEIRSLVVKVYDTHYKAIEGITTFEKSSILEVMRPYYLTHFEDIRPLQSAVPYDAEQLLADPYFHNIMDYRLLVLKNNQLIFYPGVIEDLELLNRKIEDYIKVNS